MCYVEGSGPQGCHYYPKCPAAYLVDGQYHRGTCRYPRQGCRLTFLWGSDGHQKAQEGASWSNTHSVPAIFVNRRTGESRIVDVGS